MRGLAAPPYSHNGSGADNHGGGGAVKLLIVVALVIALAIAYRVRTVQLHEARQDAWAMRNVIALGRYSRRAD